LLEDRPVALGAEYHKAPEPWAPYVTVDGNLYTGQNPASSRELAERLVKDLAQNEVEGLTLWLAGGPRRRQVLPRHADGLKHHLGCNRIRRGCF